jgi:hypothetical protein
MTANRGEGSDRREFCRDIGMLFASAAALSIPNIAYGQEKGGPEELKSYPFDILIPGHELTAAIIDDSKREVSKAKIHDKYHLRNINLRKIVSSQLQGSSGALLFGSVLDSLVEEIRLEVENNMDQTLVSVDSIELPDYQRTVNVPENFLLKDEIKQMNLRVEVTKSDRKIKFYQEYGLYDILVLESGVAIGGAAKDNSTGKVRNFPTPTGNFALKELYIDPTWFPPKWSGKTEAIGPGPGNPYGKYMTILYYVRDGKFIDSGVRFHSTNKPSSIGKAASHGCMRLHPDVAEELFNALIYYCTSIQDPKDAVQRLRGKEYPLNNLITVKITEH